MSRMQPTPYFHVGQKVVCIDASPNRLGGAQALRRGKIYTVRAIFDEPGWSAPGWGIYLEEVRIAHFLDEDMEWPIDPRRFRPVTERKTDISELKKLLSAVPAEP